VHKLELDIKPCSQFILILYALSSEFEALNYNKGNTIQLNQISKNWYRKGLNSISIRHIASKELFETLSS
jgi:hypothetical protein